MRHLLASALLLNAALASSAAFSGRLPARPLPLAAQSVRLPILPLTTLPGVSLPAAQGGVNLPGKLPPLPIQLPVEVAPAAPVAAAPFAEEDGEGFFLRWDLLDGDDGLAGALLPNAPSPKPLSPAGAMRELERVEDAPFEGFDGSKRVPVFVR